MALARRHLLKPLHEPLYEFEDVPYCSKSDTLQNSVLQRIDSREKWLQILPELLLVCNEAALRAAIKARSRHEQKMRAWKTCEDQIIRCRLTIPVFLSVILCC